MNIRKKLIFTLVFALFALPILYFKFGSTPNFLKNTSSTDIKPSIQVSKDDRKPIIFTFKESEYKKLSSENIQDFKNKSKGRVEGEIPCVYLSEDKNLHIEFLKGKDIIKPDEIPSIKLSIYPTSSQDENQDLRVVEDFLKEDGDKYIYEIKRYRTQYDKYFLEILDVELNFKIDGEEYISLFSICSSNVEKDAEAVENEPLKEPVLAE
ncbi:hypothetical protein [Anaerosphaera multitolerans]|uniref:Uncharacterized protein n=1 Tax=Anaerosphaera multitolerans TaxID=2487351 RepID=A0A437S4M4_9FIRM|nr:hypothetical protein [Anaerosphaera multitolerans]RVU53985.1 hypothetical protein EF514_09725 [Anaerosphaera multitolerans]